MTFRPDTPLLLQNDGWSCFPTSLRMALEAWGRQPSESWIESQMIADGIESTDLGLLDGSGARAAQWITEQYAEPGGNGPALVARNATSVSFDDVRSVAGTAGVLLGSSRWGPGGHWTFVRRYNPATDQLELGNPAGPYAGVDQTMSRQQFAERAPWSTVIISPDGHEDTGGNPADPDTLTDEPDHLFSLKQLWPSIKAAGAEFGFDPQVLAGIILQESTWRNWRVHRDGTGHGLLGLDDNGLLPDFERWSGLTIGRGQEAASIPITPQIRYAAHALADYANRLGGPYAAARAWHRGEGLMNDARGQSYEALIRQHVATLFASGEPEVVAPAPPAPPAGEPFAFVLGFADLAARLGADVVGTPLENEHPAERDGHQISHQLTSKGELIWWRNANLSQFYPAA